MLDNFFEGSSLTIYGGPFNCSHNAGTGPIGTLPGADNIEEIVPDYVAGPLGNFYYPATGNSLASLINHGDASAAGRGLFHYTTTLDQKREGSSTVDIGMHYVALNTAGSSVDFDGDSLADYFEDSNGNGMFEANLDLSDYRNTDSDGDGLPDNYEYFVTHTDPSRVLTGPNTGIVSDAYKDPDGDGLTNQEEMQSGKNPLVPDVATPLFSPVGGTYASAQTVTITCPTAGATIRYTLDGSEPTTTSTAYSAPISVPVNTTLKAKAFKTGWTPSDTESEGYQTAANTAPTISVLPASGLTFSASDSIEVLVQGADTDGTIAKLQLYRGNLKIAEAAPGPLRFTLQNVPSGTYAFTARAIDDKGAVTVSSSVTITINVNSGGPIVSLVGAQPFFTSSPGALLATVTGVNPGSIVNETLVVNGVNGNVPLRAGSFVLYPNLVEGENAFTLTAWDSQGHHSSATTKVYLDSVAPTVAISKPVDNYTLGTTRVNVTGTFTEASLKRITVNGILAFITGPGTFEVRNVPLEVGANTIVATAEDIAGNMTSATINVTGSATLLDPVQLTATPIAGFDPLTVSFSIVQQNVSGTAYIDFEGDGGAQIPFSANHIYTAGQHFPVVTIQTADGNFSSTGGWNASPSLRVNVQQPPSQIGSSITINDPVDLKIGGPSGHLYVLSRSDRLVNEYDSVPAFVRSFTLASGSIPTGLDVDTAGNVYVALSGHHQVAKYKFVSGSYTPDTTFNGTGLIGKSDHASGNSDGQFNTPYDVAISPDGAQIAVSDSANHRIQQFKTSDGSFVSKFGAQGNGDGQFNTPKGLTYDGAGYLYIVDSGNGRIMLINTALVLVGTSGSSGTALGQFQGAVGIGVGGRGLYISDAGNNRVQMFDPVSAAHESEMIPFRSRGTLSAETSPALNEPYAIANVFHFTEERFYVADKGNDRVVLVRVQLTGPDGVWSTLRNSVAAEDIDSATACFANLIKSRYLSTFRTVGSSRIKQLFSDLPAVLTTTAIDDSTAECYFVKTIDGTVISFPVEFIKENGIWKITDL